MSAFNEAGTNELEPKQELPIDERFLPAVKELLKHESPVRSRGGEVYRVVPGTDVYPLLRDLVRRQLEHLPFHDEVGRTMPIMPWTRQVVRLLIGYLRTVDQPALTRGQLEILAKIDLLTKGDRELFTNEIYSAHGTRGICYNVDLVGMRSSESQRDLIIGLSIERFIADATQGSVQVQRNGIVRVNFLNQSIEFVPNDDVLDRVHDRA